MRGKSVALLVLALGCGLVASLGITQVLAKRGDRTAAVATTPVFVAKSDIPSGALVSLDNLRIEQWPTDKVPQGTLVKQDNVDGRRARYKIFSGQPILDPMLLARGEVPTDSMIPKGLRVVAIPVETTAIQGGLVLPGSRCDLQVFIRADPSNGIGETISKTVLQDIKVFAVNDVTSTESADPKDHDQVHSIPAGKTVSLLVTPPQAEMVTLASQLGTIRLILRSAEDNAQPKSQPMTIKQFLGTAGGANRSIENPKKADDEKFDKWAAWMKSKFKDSAKMTQEKAPRVARPAQFMMRVRSGPVATDVILTADSGVNGLPTNAGSWTATNLPPQTSAPHDAKTAEPTPPAGAAPAAQPAAPQNDASPAEHKIGSKPAAGT